MNLLSAESIVRTKMQLCKQSGPASKAQSDQRRIKLGSTEHIPITGQAGGMERRPQAKPAEWQMVRAPAKESPPFQPGKMSSRGKFPYPQSIRCLLHITIATLLILWNATFTYAQTSPDTRITPALMVTPNLAAVRQASQVLITITNQNSACAMQLMTGDSL